MPQAAHASWDQPYQLFLTQPIRLEVGNGEVIAAGVGDVNINMDNTGLFKTLYLHQVTILSVCFPPHLYQ